MRVIKKDEEETEIWGRGPRDVDGSLMRKNTRMRRRK